MIIVDHKIMSSLASIARGSEIRMIGRQVIVPMRKLTAVVVC